MIFDKQKWNVTVNILCIKFSENGLKNKHWTELLWPNHLF